MATIEVGRVCIKTHGKDTGKKVVIVKKLDDNFVEIDGDKVKRKRCNITHLMPLEEKAEVASK